VTDIVPVIAVVVVKVEPSPRNGFGILVGSASEREGQIGPLNVGVTKDGLPGTGVNARQDAIGSASGRQSGKSRVTAESQVLNHDGLLSLRDVERAGLATQRSRILTLNVERSSSEGNVGQLCNNKRINYQFFDGTGNSPHVM
jgi:hypothetical protein